MAIPKIASYTIPQLETFPENTVDWKIDPKKAVVLVYAPHEPTGRCC
ncbi:hypothetical protein M892_02825 [Vibrio campbellii ATCC BAA-1116]|nr:hypothetical protein M892_02825 [Vibrio campbellii ATCC BAA-1116]